MDKNEFKKYLKERYNDQIDWYNKKSIRNHKIYSTFQLTLIILSSLTPILILITLGFPDYYYLQWIPIIISIIVAILASALKTFKFEEKWINYRTTCETLKKEIHLYHAQANQYSNASDKEALFVDRVEHLISSENTLWIDCQTRKVE